LEAGSRCLRRALSPLRVETYDSGVGDTGYLPRGGICSGPCAPWTPGANGDTDIQCCCRPRIAFFLLLLLRWGNTPRNAEWQTRIYTFGKFLDLWKIFLPFHAGVWHRGLRGSSAADGHNVVVGVIEQHSRKYRTL